MLLQACCRCKMRLTASRLRRRFSARPSGPRKVDGTAAAAASARPWCTLLHTHDCKNVRKASWSASKAARSSDARTAFPGQMALRGPVHVDPILGELLAMLVRQLAGAAGAWLFHFVVMDL